MGFLAHAGRRLARLAEVIEQPRLAALRVRGVPFQLSSALDKRWLRDLGIRTVLDVGANTGQFALAARHVFPCATIHSFEPLPDCFAELRRRTAHDAAVVAHQVALGERRAKVAFQRNAYTPSSSMLGMLPTHVEAFPFTGQTRSVQVEMDRLDDVAPSLHLEEEVLVKIDVQGYEDRVLAGGEATMRAARVLIIETSFVELYRDQPTHEAVAALVGGWGFHYAGALDQLACPRTDRVLSADSIFVRGDGTDPGAR